VWPEIQKTGYGPLALKPWELQRLTPADYRRMVEGYGWREEHEAYKRRWQAWYGALLPYFKKVPSYEEFVDGKDQLTWQESKSVMLSMAAVHNKGVSKDGEHRRASRKNRG